MSFLAQNITVTVYQDLDKAMPAWRIFSRNSDGYVFQQYEWLSAWHKTVGCRRRLTPCLVAVHGPDNSPLIFLPLAIQKVVGASCLVWLGGQLADYHAPILHKDFSRQVSADDFRALWSRILEALPPVDVVCFEKQPEMVGQQPNPFFALPGQVPHETNFSCRLEKDWLHFYNSRVPAKIRADSRRRRRRLQELGELRFVVADSAESAALITGKMIEQKGRRYLETGTYNLFGQPQYRDFFLKGFTFAENSALLHVSALTLNDEIIAAHWGMVHEKRFYHFMPSLGKQWRKYAPGRLLLEHLIQWSFANNLEVFDFTVGKEEYKRVWHTGKAKLSRYRRPFNLKGRFFIMTEKIKDAVRKISPLHRTINRLRNSF